MTEEDIRAVKGGILLEHAEAMQTLNTALEMKKKWAKGLEVLGRLLGEGKNEVPAEFLHLLDLPKLCALLSEITDLVRKREALEKRRREVGLSSML